MEFVLLIILSFILLTFAILALKSNFKSVTNQFFFLFVVFTISWIITNYLSNTLTDINTVLWLNRGIFLSTTLVFWFVYLFAHSYPNTELINKNKLIIWGSVITAIISLLSLSDFIVKGVKLFPGYSEIDFGVGIIVYVGYIITILILFFITLYKKLTLSHGLEKTKIQYLVLGIGFSAIPISISNLFLPLLLNFYLLSNLGPFFLLIFIGFSSVSIIKHRLFGVNYILGSILRVILISLFPFISYYLVIDFEVLLWGSIYNPTSITVGYFISIVFVIAFVFFNKNITKFIDRKVINYGANIEETKDIIFNKISVELDLNIISDFVIQAIKESLKIEDISILLYEISDNKLIHKKIAYPFSEDELMLMFNYAKTFKETNFDDAIVKDEVFFNHDHKIDSNTYKLAEYLKDKKQELIIPLILKVNLVGVIIVGPKLTRNGFSAQDINFLSHIARNLSVAYSRSYLYEKVQEFNKTLKEEVNKATEQLEARLVDLEQARQKERDMLDILGHELRTPLTIAKNSAILIHEMAFKGTVELPKLQKYADMAEENMRRESKLLETMLSTTKIDNDKLELNLDKVDMNDVVNDSFAALTEKAIKKGLDLKFEASTQSIAYADRDRTQEVVDNLIDNSIKYTDHGSVKVSLKNSDSFSILTVSDTGIGMSRGDLERIGTKFYRSQNYVNTSENTAAPVVRAGGTGLGLYVTFALVKRMGGSIEVESEIGKGSIFTVKLPLYTGQAAVNTKSKTLFQKFNELRENAEK